MREITGVLVTVTWVPVVVVELDVVLVLVLVLDTVGPDVLMPRDEVPDDPETPVPWMTGVPDGWVATVGGGATVPLPGLMMVVTVPTGLLEPEPPEPEPEPPEPEPEPEPPEPEPEPEPPEPEPEPVDTGVAGVVTTGAGVATTGAAGVVTVGVLEPVVPEPLVPLPEPLVPVLVGAELWVGWRPATGREIVAELEWWTVRWAAAVPWPDLRQEAAALAGDRGGHPGGAARMRLDDGDGRDPASRMGAGLGVRGQRLGGGRADAAQLGPAVVGDDGAAEHEQDRGSENQSSRSSQAGEVSTSGSHEYIIGG